MIPSRQPRSRKPVETGGAEEKKRSWGGIYFLIAVLSPICAHLPSLCSNIFPRAVWPRYDPSDAQSPFLLLPLSSPLPGPLLPPPPPQSSLSLQSSS
eukprot:761681-Hanusia_phi.AAC.2